MQRRKRLAVVLSIALAFSSAADTKYTVSQGGAAKVLTIELDGSSRKPGEPFRLRVVVQPPVEKDVTAIEVYEDGYSVAKVNGTTPFVLTFGAHKTGEYEFYARALNRYGRQLGDSEPFTLTVPPPGAVASLSTGGLVPGGSSTAVGTTIPVVATAGTADWNGIGVGLAKTFDDRSLGAMLQEVQASLAGRFIDAASLNAAIGRFQGASATTTSFGLAASTLPLPATEQTSELTNQSAAPSTVAVTEDGVTTITDSTATQSTTDKTTNTVTRAAVSPAVATLPAQSSVFSFAAPFGVSASDLLAEQTELTYQALNLRLLLQRAISDKALIEPSSNGLRLDQRLQVVLGFQVSLDAPARWKHRRAVAEVIVNIAAKDTNRRTDAPSLVALLPREKTYNVASVRRGSSAFNFGAVVQPLNVGAAFSRSRETMYLVKDTDTVALERRSSAENDVEFAWQFRPVLGQASVTPGLRQMFAVLSFPAGVDERWDGEVQVTTRWRAYNARRKVVGEVFTETVNTYDPYPLRIDSTNDQALALSPKTESIYWEDTGDGNVVVTVGGRFPLGTRVAAGDRLLQAGSAGLVLDSQRRMTFVVPAQTLFLGDIALVDAFGESRPVLQPRANDLSVAEGDLPEGGYKHFTAVAAPVGVDKARVQVCLAPVVNRDDHRPLFRVGQTVFGLADTPVTFTEKTFDDTEEDRKLATQCGFGKKEERVPVLLATFRAPIGVVKAAGTLQTIDPFWGDRYVATTPLAIQQNPKSIVASEVKFLTLGNKPTLAITGDNLDDHSVKVFLGNQEVRSQALSPSLLTLTVDRETLSRLRQIIVTSHTVRNEQLGEPQVALLKIPLADLARPHVLRYSPIEQGQLDVITLEGGDLFAIREIRFSDQKLDFTADAHAPSTVIHVRPSRALTRIAGQKELTIVSADGSVQTFVLVVRDRSRS